MSSELHIFGAINGFQQNLDELKFFSNDNLFLNYQLVYGDNWQLISGKQYSITASSDAIWSEPVDWHFSLSSIQNWPKLKFFVYKENLSLLNNINNFKFDTLEGSSTPYATGFCYLPTKPGYSTTFVKLTAPRSPNFWTSTSNLINEYTGLATRKNNRELEQYFEQQFEDNTELELEPKLTIKLELYVINRFFKRFGVECK